MQEHYIIAAKLRGHGVRFTDDAFASLNRKLDGLINEILPKDARHLIRYTIIETELYDEEIESVNDAYPVLMVEIALVDRAKLWLLRKCPYILIVHNFGMRLCDEYGNNIDNDDIVVSILMTLYSTV